MIFCVVCISGQMIQLKFNLIFVSMQKKLIVILRIDYESKIYRVKILNFLIVWVGVGRVNGKFVIIILTFKILS